MSASSRRRRRSSDIKLRQRDTEQFNVALAKVRHVQTHRLLRLAGRRKLRVRFAVALRDARV